MSTLRALNIKTKHTSIIKIVLILYFETSHGFLRIKKCLGTKIEATEIFSMNLVGISTLYRSAYYNFAVQVARNVSST